MSVEPKKTREACCSKLKVSVKIRSVLPFQHKCERLRNVERLWLKTTGLDQWKDIYEVNSVGSHPQRFIDQMYLSASRIPEYLYYRLLLFFFFVQIKVLRLWHQSYGERGHNPQSDSSDKKMSSRIYLWLNYSPFCSDRAAQMAANVLYCCSVEWSKANQCKSRQVCSLSFGDSEPNHSLFGQEVSSATKLGTQPCHDTVVTQKPSS